MLIVDGHQDIAWNMLTFRRDMLRSALDARRSAAVGETPAPPEDSLVGYPEYRRGRVALIVASLFAAPQRAAEPGENQVYADARQAARLYHAQVDAYLRLADDHPEAFNLVGSAADLERVLAQWRKLPPPAVPADANQGDSLPERERPSQPGKNGAGKSKRDRSQAEASALEDAEPIGPPVGLVISMEGAECIREPAEVEVWWERGVRLIGPAWRSTPYCGGTLEPGPLTSAGFELLERMAGLNFGLDLSHMDEQAALQALDFYPGVTLASHSNAQALLRGAASNRHLSDRVIGGIIERDGVIGIVPFIAFLKAGWKRGDRRLEGRLDMVAAQIDYICQAAGDARHVGIGSDFDGGFGRQSTPPGIETIADLHKLAPLLRARGYSDTDIAAVFGENWLALLRRILPDSR